MTTKVFFYLLNERFVENDEQVPEQTKQVMYYSLAIGHHVGVIDCFKNYWFVTTMLINVL